MAEAKGTQLRCAKFRSPEELCEGVSSMMTKVEIKEIVKDGSSWVVFFVPPDHIVKRIPISIKNMDLTDL